MNDYGIVIPTEPRINTRALTLLGMFGVIIILAFSVTVALVSTEHMRAELKATKTRLIAAETDARTAYIKLYDQQEKFGEEVEALNGAHSIELYNAMRKCSASPI